MTDIKNCDAMRDAALNKIAECWEGAGYPIKSTERALVAMFVAGASWQEAHTTLDRAATIKAVHAKCAAACEDQATYYRDQNPFVHNEEEEHKAEAADECAQAVRTLNFSSLIAQAEQGAVIAGMGPQDSSPAIPQIWEYMISYVFPSGSGRCFLKTNQPIDSQARVVAVEASVQKTNGMSLTVTGFQLLAVRDAEPLPAEKTKCDHIIGQAVMLNPEEGQAYINRFLHQGQTPPRRERNFMFAHCPLCGEKINHDADIQAQEIVASDSPRWVDEDDIA